jgi:hypothetical protein
MPSSHPLPPSCHWFSRLASALDPRSAPRLAWLLVGAVLARGRRTVTSWIRAAGLSAEFRPCYTTVSAVGKRADLMAAHLAYEAVKPLVAGAERLTFALDDTPTERYGRRVQGAGVHHNPTPGPAGGPFVYGHVWVVLGLLARHPVWGTIALPLLSRLYVRQKDLTGIAPKHRPPFRTKLELAVELMRWATEKRYKTFVATWRPAGGVIRVVLVDEPKGWAAFFCTDPAATVADILESVAGRFSLETCFRDLKEVVGAGQQQVRLVRTNIGAFHVCLWAFTMTEAWAWNRAEKDLVGHRSASPWDDESRRPSHADKRRAWRRELLANEIRAALRVGATEWELHSAAERLLNLAA